MSISLGRFNGARRVDVKAVAGLFLVAALAAGCGGGDGDSTSDEATDSASAGMEDGTGDGEDGGEAEGSEGPAGATEDLAGTVDVCALLPGEDAVEVLGEGVEPMEMPSSGWAAGQCAWTDASGGLLVSVSVGTQESIANANDPAGSDAEARLATYRTQSEAAGETQDVSGIGDAAVSGPLGMAVRAEDTYLEAVRLSATPEQLSALMERMVANL